MEVAAVLYFLRKGVKLHFYSLGTIFEENMRVSRGMQSLGSGFPIGARSIPVGTRFCLQSLVCYTLCRRCCENAVAAGEGKGIFTAGKQGCDCVARSRKRRTGFISRQGVYESPVPRPTPNYGTKCPRRIATFTRKQTGFLLKIEMGGKPF